MYIWVFLADSSFFSSMYFFNCTGIEFYSKYSLFYIGGGIIVTPFISIVHFGIYRGLIPGKILLSIILGREWCD